MIPIDFAGKVALVTGVGDNDSFAWYIGKTLQAAGATVVLACHPRMLTIVENLLKTQHADDAAKRKLPDGTDFAPAKIFPCDASYDTMADVPEEVRELALEVVEPLARQQCVATREKRLCEGARIGASAGRQAVARLQGARISRARARVGSAI